jgi:hypothetical protein
MHQALLVFGRSNPLWSPIPSNDLRPMFQINQHFCIRFGRLMLEKECFLDGLSFLHPLLVGM